MAQFSVSFDLILRENPAISDNNIAVVTPLFNTWRSSTTDWEGNWFGEGKIVASPRATPNFMRNFFRNNIGRRIVLTSGGVDYWEGQIVEMELNDGGKIARRSMLHQANSLKMIYTKVGDNEITNTSVESAGWTQIGTPSTYERSTVWSARGDYSQHIIADGATEGSLIDDGSGTGLSITAGVTYECSVIVKVESGTWRLQVLQGGTTTVVAQRVLATTGRQWLACSVPETNTYTGEIDVRIVSDGAGEIYVDAAVFRVAGAKAETEWFTQADSVEEFGTMQMVLLEGETGDDEAVGNAQRIRDEYSYPRTIGPGTGSTVRLDFEERSHLIVTCMGLYWTLAWTYIMQDIGTGDASVQLETVLDLTEFFTAAGSAISENTTEVQLFVDDPTTVAEVVEKVLEVGDGAGGSYVAGAYPGRMFVYTPRPTVTNYRISNAQLLWRRGGPVNPLQVKPGWALDMDLPIDDVHVSGDDANNPRRVWLEEVWFVYENGVTTAEWSVEDEEYLITR